MAEENKIFYKIEVHGEQGLATIRNMKGEFVKTKVPVENLNQVMSNMNGTMAVTSNEAGRQMAKLKRLRSNVQINSKEYQNLTKAMMSYQKVLDGTGRATGASASAAMELGRVVSDMPYGIRGVANNLSQFASQMAFSAKATGSLKLAIKDLWKALMGPLGVLIAIQAVIAALDHFSQKKKESSKVSKEHNDALRKEVETLQGYNNVTINASSSINDMNNAIIAAAASSKDFRKALSQTNSDLTSQQEALKRVLEEKENQLELDDKLLKLNSLNKKLKGERRSIEEIEAAIKRATELEIERTRGAGMGAIGIAKYYGEERDRLRGIIGQLEQRKKLMEDIANLFKPERKVNKDSIEGLKIQIAQQEKLREQVSWHSSQWDFYTKKIEKLQKRIKAITGETEKVGKDKKMSPFKTPKELDIDIKNAENSMIQMSKKMEDARLKEELNDALSQAKTEEEKQEIREAYQVKRLENQIKAEGDMLKLKKSTEESMVKTKTKNHIDDLKKARELFETKVRYEQKLGNLTKEQADTLIADSKSKFEKAETQALNEQTASMSDIASKYEPLFQLFEDLSAARFDALYSGFGITKEGEKEDFSFEDGLKHFMEMTTAATDFMNSEFDRQITIEQNKTNALNNELNQRLLNENLSKEERKRIQLEIGANDEKLRKTQEKIEKKRFKMNKAANIAQATISTYLAAADVLANEKLGAIGKIAMMSVVIGAGLAQVAAIARTKFQSSAGSGGQIGGGFGGSDGGRDRSFNFNLAGASRENQLAQTLQGRFDQPIQTYVVSRDITNSQQLDEDIRNNASFG